jgi:hypothetical protein
MEFNFFIIFSYIWNSYIRLGASYLRENIYKVIYNKIKKRLKMDKNVHFHFRK